MQCYFIYWKKVKGPQVSFSFSPYSDFLIILVGFRSDKKGEHVVTRKIENTMYGYLHLRFLITQFYCSGNSTSGAQTECQTWSIIGHL